MVCSESQSEETVAKLQEGRATVRECRDSRIHRASTGLAQGLSGD